MSVASRSSSRFRRHRSLPILVMVAVFAAALAPVTMLEIARGVGLTAPNHLVVSEVVTGGASASDELIELHNPTTSALPLEGLEVIYVTSTGATITRRAAWEVGAPSVPAGGHVLIANASGIYASIADATYASGMAATGGSVAIRILGASTAVDAVGWGTTTSSWREGVAGARSRDRRQHRAPARRSARLRHRHRRQRRRLCRAPRPRAAEPRLGADAGPGCGDPAAPSVGDARRTADHARSDADHDADPDGDARAASGDPDRGGSRRARWDRGDDRGCHAHRLRLPRRGWLRRRPDWRDRRPPRRWDRSGPASWSASPARSTIGSPSARFAPMPVRS